MVPEREHSSWATLISRHAELGQSRQGLKIYEEMQSAGLRPSSHTYVAAVRACARLKDIDNVKRIHADLLASGLGFIVFVGNTMVDVYAKCGSLDDARDVFDSMPHRDVISWNAIISGYAQMQLGEEALQLYSRMKQEGFVPNDRTFVSALKACLAFAAAEVGEDAYGTAKRGRCLENARTIHSEILSSRSDITVYIGTMLVNVYVKCGSLPDARDVFDKMANRNVVSWTVMILGYAQAEDSEVALQLYSQMQREGVAPNDRTFVAALKACSLLAVREEKNEAGAKSRRQQCLEQTRSIHLQAVRSGHEKDVFVGTMLVDVYVKCGSLADARFVFEKMPYRDVVSWTVMILGCAQIGAGDMALELYSQMKQERIAPDVQAFVGALKACSSLASLNKVGRTGHGSLCLHQVRTIHSHITSSGLEMEAVLGTVLVDAYIKCGSLVEARRVFENLPRRDVVSWTSIIMGYVQNEEGDVALSLYTRMEHEDVVPNDWTFVGALKACGTVAGLDKGKMIHAQIVKTRRGDYGSFLASGLVDMYAKCGSMIDARELFDTLLAKDIVTWNALIAGYARQGASEVVFNLFERMKLDGVQPDGITFLSILTICSHAGLVDKGHEFFESMSKAEITPAIEHYTCMVDLLSRAGQVEKAMDIIRTMPFQPDLTVWQAILSACLKWSHVEIGRHAFESAMELDKGNAVAYVLMCNIYAAAQMWAERNAILRRQVENQAQKVPGKSWWTEVCGVVHAFEVGDSEHPDCELVYSSLQILNLIMQEDNCNASLGGSPLRYQFRCSHAGSGVEGSLGPTNGVALREHHLSFHTSHTCQPGNSQ